MCGIAGTTSLTRYTKSMLPYLAYDIEDRGTDSWSIFNNHSIVKRLGKISDGYHIPKEFDMGDPIMIHTRNASTGKVSLENQHPFVEIAEDKSKMIVGMHNGCIHNHTELADKNGWKEKYEVDSHILFKMLANDKDQRDVRGWGNCAWFEWDGENGEFKKSKYTIKFVRFNADNLEIAKLEDGTLVFCSLKSSIQKAARFARVKIDKFYKIDGDNLYEFTPGDDELRDLGKMVFGSRATYSRADSRADGTWRGHGRGQAYTPSWNDTSDMVWEGYVNRGQSGSSGNFSYEPPAEHTTHDTTYLLDRAGWRGRKQGRCGVCKTEGKINRDEEYVCKSCMEDIVNAVLELEEPSTPSQSKYSMEEVYGISVFGAWLRNVGSRPSFDIKMNWDGGIDIHGRELVEKEAGGNDGARTDAAGTAGDVKSLTVVPRNDEATIGVGTETSAGDIERWGQTGRPSEVGEHNGDAKPDGGNAVEVHGDSTESFEHYC